VTRTYVVAIADDAGPCAAALESLLCDQLAPDPALMAEAGVAVMRGEDFAARIEADARHARKAWNSLTRPKERRRAKP
jgi:hypothetical protein